MPTVTRISLTRHPTYLEAVFASPMGEHVVVADDAGVRIVGADGGGVLEGRDHRILTHTIGVSERAERHLADMQTWLEWFFTDPMRLPEPRVTLAPVGTAFQMRAWDALRRIPFGQTRTYAQQAVAIGQPTATRAVGAANGANTLGIIIPCHRVIGSSGHLTGFGGGLDKKQWLLDHEARHAGGAGGDLFSPSQKEAPAGAAGGAFPNTVVHTRTRPPAPPAAQGRPS